MCVLMQDCIVYSVCKRESMRSTITRLWITGFTLETPTPQLKLRVKVINLQDSCDRLYRMVTESTRSNML